MLDDVRRDLVWSASAFLDVIWPRIARLCGDGELVPIELVSEKEWAQQMDLLAGIDAWQIQTKNGMRGIGSRVQKIDGRKSAFDTFTIRYSRNTGAETEYSKRLRAITDQSRGWLYPHLTIQGYVAKCDSSFLSAAIVRTRQLYTFVSAHLHDSESVYLKRNGRDGNTFLCIEWETLRRNGICVAVVRNGGE